MSVAPAKLPRTAEEVVDTKAFFNRVLPLYEQGVGDIGFGFEDATQRVQHAASLSRGERAVDSPFVSA